MELSIPELSLVVLIGVTGSGKSTFARPHFRPTEVISSDFCRGLVADDENDQSATAAAFEVLQFIAGQRLEAGRLTVIDATNVQPEARRELVMLAREYDVLPVGDRARPAGKALRRAERRPAGPGLRPARAPPPARPAPPRAARARPRRVPHRARAAHPGGGRRRPRSPAPGCTATCGTRPARSTSSATCTAAGPNSSSCWRRSATRSTATRPAARSAPATPEPARRLRRRPGRPGPRHAGRAAPGHGHGRGRDRVLRGRQPRGQAAQGAARQERQAQPRPGRLDGAAGRSRPRSSGPARSGSSTA